MTSKGQVTIPQDLRARFNLGPGTEVDVVATGEGALVRPARLRGGGARLIEQLRDRADGGMTADEILRLTRTQHD